ncbi:hypothetical protein GcC1_173037 [Golovinomyces cichoracearum]|uniref:Uncharacterized protein n=1 Tax=Golovinomyces cichoracearum TaxID=62708 RepID=A0A420HQE9_9PEZI|nr:hypothetical protein GcC1_173037 [Golovinomyces cichoracearum]
MNHRKRYKNTRATRYYPRLDDLDSYNGKFMISTSLYKHSPAQLIMFVIATTSLYSREHHLDSRKRISEEDGIQCVIEGSSVNKSLSWQDEVDSSSIPRGSISGEKARPQGPRAPKISDSYHESAS